MARTITRPQFEALRTAAPVAEWQDLPATHPLACLKARRAVAARRSTLDVLVRLGLVEVAESAVCEETGRPWNRIHALTPAGEVIAASLEEGGPLVTLDRIAEAVAAQAATPATKAPATPGDVVRPGVKIRKDGRMKWTVERDGHMGVIFDEEGMKRGRWAAWSPFARTRHNIAAFTDDAEAAVDAILATLPMRIKALAAETGATPEEIRREAAALEEEREGETPAVRVTPRRGVELTGPAVLAIRETLAARTAGASAEEPAEEAASVPGVPEWRTLKGLQAPFFLYGEERGRGWRPAGDRKRVTGQPLRIVRAWMDRGLRYAEDENGRELALYGAAAKFWTAPVR